MIIQTNPLFQSAPMNTTFVRLFVFCLCCLASFPTGAEEPVPHITFQTIQLSNVFFSEGADAGDFNKDGHPDVVSGPFWYAGPDFEKKYLIYEPKPFNPLGYSDNFFAFTDDFNRDGWVDVLVYGFPGKQAWWFENPGGQERLWTRHTALEVVDNESPMYVDINQDGKREIICSSGGYFGYAHPDPKDPTAMWIFHRISDKSAGGRFTHGLGTGDVNGDGRVDLLEKSGWWEQPPTLEGDPQWKKHPFPFSRAGGAQMFAYDVDGDGDSDVITSLAAHGYGLAWYEQVLREGNIDFLPHLIMGDKPEENPYGVCFSQLHAVELVDIDGDGLKDIVTGKRYWAHGPHGDAEPNAAPVVYWFRLVRDASKQGPEGVSFIPFPIDDNSGVGTEVTVSDLNGDQAPDVIVGNKKGTFVHLQQRKSVSKWEYERLRPRKITEAAQASSAGLPRNQGLDPQAAARAMTVPNGFQVDLAAGEPLVHQPVAFTIDARGRLWIAEAHTYPIRAPEGKGRDKIIILEDRDRNGSFEHRKVFAEGLNLVSGLEVGFGGVWVGAAPYLMFIPDKNGDDIPDSEPEILLDGWGYQDTHETLNAFLWGPDGWLYGCQGVFTHSLVGKPGTPHSERTPLNCCVWRYHPTRHDFEVFAHGSSNPWGVDFNEHGQAFITACVIPHLFHVIQGARYHRQGGQHFNPYTFDDIKTIADHAHYAGNIRDHAWWGRNEAVPHNDTHAAGGGHAHCGAMIYLGDNWPLQYRNTIFMANIHGNRINNDLLKREGSGFVGSHGQDFLYANDRWFRGINLKYGPQGEVYLIDWYDKNACHRRSPEIWDRTNGRVYRITFGEVIPQKVELASLSDEELIQLHGHQNDWYVRMARRLLQERTAGNPERADRVGKKLILKLHDSQPVDRKLRILWTLHAVSGVPEMVTKELLAAQGPETEYLRAWGIQLELEDRQVSDAVYQQMVDLARTDRSPVVRLYLASALQRLPYERRWPIAEALLQHAEDQYDHNLPLLIWYGVEPLVPADPARALPLAMGSRIPLVRRFIYRRAAVDHQTLPLLLTALGRAKEESQQAMMLEEITNAVRTQGRLEMPPEWPEVYAKLSKSPTEKIREQAQFITVKFGDKSIFPALRAIVADPNAKSDSRRAALSALLTGRDSKLPSILHRLLKDDRLRSDALKGLARFDHPETARVILTSYADFSEAEKQDALSTLASRVHYALALLDAIEAGEIPRQDLTAFTIGQMQRLNDQSVTARVNAVWGTLRATPEEKLRLITRYKRQLTPQSLSKADRSHGRAVYKKHCGKCHKLYGDGGNIGPDLTGSNRANLDYLLQNVLDPSAVVGKDYQMTTVVTNDGRTISGLIKEENDSALTLQTVNEAVVIDKSDIDIRKKSELSLMPEGQLKEMSAAEIRDLIAYLGSRRQVPLPGEGPVYDEQNHIVAGALEGESLKIAAKSRGAARPQGMGVFTADHWSGDSQLWWTGAQPGDQLVLEFPVREEGTYELFVVLTKAQDYGIVQLSIDGHPVGEPIDLYNHPDVVTTGVLSVKTDHFSAGPHKLGVKITGAHPQAIRSYMFGLDYLYLARKTPNKTAEGE